MENALVLIDKARANGALIFAPQNLDTPPLYKVEMTEITAKPDEFHSMQGGKYMPNKAVTDRIGEAAGVDFIAEKCGTRKEGSACYVGWAQGRVRQPDGGWRYSTVEEYEFDVDVRCEEEFLKGKKDGDSTRPYNEREKAQKRIELSKVARARASTGARLRVIRQLTGMPVALTAAEKSKPLVFSRIVQNTDYILGTKEGKMMAIAMATGAANMLYGQRSDTTPEPGPSSADAFDEDPPMRDVTESASTSDLAGQALGRDPFDIGPEPENSSSPQEDPEVSKLIQALTDYIATGLLPKEGADLISSALSRNERNLEVLRDLVARAKKAYDAVMARRRASAQAAVS